MLSLIGDLKGLCTVYEAIQVQYENVILYLNKNHVRYWVCANVSTMPLKEYSSSDFVHDMFMWPLKKLRMDGESRQRKQFLPTSMIVWLIICWTCISMICCQHRASRRVICHLSFQAASKVAAKLTSMLVFSILCWIL